MRALVAIASYGTGNDQYLAMLIREYRSMSFEVDIVVLSNIEKNPGAGVEVVVGLPYRDPWTLPFPHRQLFADKLNEYDLFIYSEDDMLVTERNIRAFLHAAEAMPAREIPGFLRYEEGPAQRNYPEFHGHFHWDTASIRHRGEYISAWFSNEHAACYLLTQQQLKRAIDSGGYLVEPHQGKYDLLCAAATDPYTQCGLRKMICVSHIDDFLIHHLPNKYVGSRFGIADQEFRSQINALLESASLSENCVPLFPTETKLATGSFSKDYYEIPVKELQTSIPSHVRTVLSVGCGWGATEVSLAERGLQVTAVPVDPVVPTRARAAGVETLWGNLDAVRRKLANRRFDCLLFQDLLHLVEDPVGLISSFRGILSDGAVVISLLPNMSRLGRQRAIGERPSVLRKMDYDTAGAHFVSPRIARNWFADAGAQVVQTINLVPPRSHKLSNLTLSLADSYLSSHFISVAIMRS